MTPVEPISFKFLSTDDLNRIDPESLAWLWKPYLARGMISLLTSRWKSGKTTLLSVLLAKLANGGELAGSPVAMGRAVVVSEEPPALWSIRQRRLGLGPHVQWLCRPFRAHPSLEQWVGLIERVAELKPDFVMFDTLGSLLPAMAEANASTITAALEPLHLLTDVGAAVLLVHHPRKCGPNGEMSPRGSTALTAYADILCELDREPNTPLANRRRRLRATSRLHDHFQCTIEFNGDETDYVLNSETKPEEGFEFGWPLLKLVFEGHYVPLTRTKILERWPEGHECPSESTLRRWLDRGIAEGLIAVRGRGTRIIPYRYTLVGWYEIAEMMNSNDPDVLSDRLEEMRYEDADSDLRDTEERLQKREKATAAKEAKRAAKEAEKVAKEGTGPL